jgi:acyl transferase domain-containing protein
VAHTLRSGRAFFQHRIGVTGGTGAELAGALARAANDLRPPAGAGGHTIHVRLGPDIDAIGRGLEAIAAAFPLLAPAEDALGSVETRVEQLLRRFGVRAKAVQDQAPSIIAAQLEWGDNKRPLITDDANEAPALLLDGLVDLFVAGADLRFDALRTPGVRFTGDLPTYPFRRERFWIDEPNASPNGRDADGADSGFSDEAQLKRSQADIEAFLETELKDLLRAEEALDRTRSFLDIGGDSFIAMLFKKGIEQRYEVDVPIDAVATELPLAMLFSQIAGHILQAAAEVREECAA